jgi:hypothetical protein
VEIIPLTYENSVHAEVRVNDMSRAYAPADNIHKLLDSLLKGSHSHWLIGKGYPSRKSALHPIRDRNIFGSKASFGLRSLFASFCDLESKANQPSAKYGCSRALGYKRRKVPEPFRRIGSAQERTLHQCTCRSTCRWRFRLSLSEARFSRRAASGGHSLDYLWLAYWLEPRVKLIPWRDALGFRSSWGFSTPLDLCRARS